MSVDPVAFLRAILPETGPYILWVKKRSGASENIFAATIEELWARQQAADAAGHSVYHACASFAIGQNDPKGTKARLKRLGRTHHNVAAVRAFWADVDAGQSEKGKPPKPYAGAREAAVSVMAFCKAASWPAPILVSSGTGLHTYWPLEKELNPKYWEYLASQFKKLCHQFGLQADPTRTADMSSVLRTPGTHHRKFGERLVECFRLVGPYKLEQFGNLQLDFNEQLKTPVKTEQTVPDYIKKLSLPDAIKDQPLPPTGPSPDALASQCKQLANFKKSGVLPEPVWHAGLGVLAFCDNGVATAHEWSQDYEGYTFEETQERLDRIRDTLSGATTCERFHDLAPGECEGCPLWGKIKSPIGALTGTVPAPKVNGHAAANLALPENFTATTELIRFPDTDGKNHIRATCRNARVAIKALGVTATYDTFHNKMLLGGQAIGQWIGEISDSGVQWLRVLTERQFGFDPGQTHAFDAAVQECLHNPFDPIADYLNGLQWDGRPRLKRWLTDYLGAEETELNRYIGTLSLAAAVRRVRVPGYKFDQIIVLESPEGRGKSSAIEVLAGSDNFSDQSILTLDDKGQQEAIQGVWLYEISDLAGMSRADVEKVKAFASRKVDRARPAYGRARVDRPRRCVFFGTTNNETYLKSQTGNRRIWPVRCGRVDLDSLARDRNQLWAEAAVAEKKLSAIALPASQWGAIGAIQEERVDRDPWLDILASITGKKSSDGIFFQISSRDIFDLHLRIPADRLTDYSSKRVATFMRKLGWDGPISLRDGDNVGKGYRRVA